MANEQHVALLRSGSEVWNAWRTTNPGVRPDLTSADFAGANLMGADLSGAKLVDTTFIESSLSGANLTGADLGIAKLERANLSSANLTDADLSSANLTGANLTGAELYQAKARFANFTDATLTGAILTRAILHSAELPRAILNDADCLLTDFSAANLSGASLCGVFFAYASFSEANLSNAILSGADLSQANLVSTDLRGSHLDGCRVFGASVWNVQLEGASQNGLLISPAHRNEPDITVDDLEVAQFVYLLLNNARLRGAIETITTKVVLLLGRFTPERKAVLDAMHAELRRRGYLPILFDFAKPSSRTTTETVLTLAAMARFVVADLTDASSVQQELSAIAFSPLTSVPVQPVLLQGSREWSMFVDHQLKGPILDPYVYESTAQLIDALPEHVIGPADQKAQELQRDMEQRYATAAARRAAP